jgi:hypothetical protein
MGSSLVLAYEALPPHGCGVVREWTGWRIEEARPHSPGVEYVGLKLRP